MFNKKLLSSIDLGKYKKKNPYKKDIILDPMGQWKHPGKNTRIPSSSITMKGVNYPVLGVSNTGQKQMMQPGKEYNFPGAEYVDEYPQMKKGGLTKAQKGIATYQDSLDVYNNALQQQAYYDKLKPYFGKVEHMKDYIIDFNQAKQAQKETSNYSIGPGWTPQDKANFQKTKNIIKNNKNKNVAYLTDIITGLLDPNAPALRYDARIKPQGVKSYSPYTLNYTSKEKEIADKFLKKYKDNLNLYDGKQSYMNKKDLLQKGKKLGYTEKEIIGILYKSKKYWEASEKLKGWETIIPYYDPLAVKPGTILTDDEIKKRVPLYGTTGIPIDRLKKLGLNNSQPPKTNTPTVVKSPCSNPITTVINNVPEKAPFGKKLVGTDEETVLVAGKKCEYVKTINPIYEDIKIEPIELQKFPVKIDNGPLPPLQMHDYTLPDPIEAPQYTLDPYTADRLSLDVKLPQNKIAALFDRGVIDSKGHIALGKRNKTRLIPRIVQKATGYDPKYFEGYEDEEGNFVPGELDYGNATGSEMEFRGAASLRDFINQQKYKKEYEEYDKKLDTWLEQYEQSKKKQAEGQAFKKGGPFQNSNIYATNKLFAKNPLFKKRKKGKKAKGIYNPKAKYTYDDGGESGCPEGYAFNPKTGECIEWNPTVWNTEDQNTSFDPIADIIYMNPNDRPEGMSDEEYNQMYQDQIEHEQLHRLQWLNDELQGESKIPLRMPSTVDNQDYNGPHYYNRRQEEVDYLHDYWKNMHPQDAEFIPDDIIYNNETDPAMYQLPWTVEGEARDYEYATHDGMQSLFPKKQKGGSIYLELDDNDIDKYVKGGYVVEDISVPSLTRMDEGGEKRKKRRNKEKNVEVIDSTEQPVTPENIEQVIEKPEVEVNPAQERVPLMMQFSNEFQENNPYDAYYEKAAYDYLKSKKGWNEALGINKSNLPENVAKRIQNNYYKDLQAYVVNKSKSTQKDYMGKFDKKGNWKPLMGKNNTLDPLSKRPTGHGSWDNYGDGSIQMVYPEQLFMGPGAGMLGLAGRAAAKGISNLAKSSLVQGTKAALSQPIANIPGVTIGNAIASGFAADAVVNRFPKVPSQIAEGDYLGALENTLTGALDVTGANMVSPLLKGIGKGVAMTPETISNLAKFIKTEGSPKLKQFFDRPPGPLMIGLGSGSKFTREVPNPDYFLDVMKLNKYNPKQKKYFESLIQTVKNQGNKASELQFEELQRIKTGDYNYGKRGIPYEALTVQKETPVFKSEIDWGKWNPETPNYPELINEYNAIEETTKLNGTWMKNPDGSSFKGSPEQFIQQNSSWFKKAFGDSKLINPDGSPWILQHGSPKKFDAFDESKFQLGDAGYSGSGIYTVPPKGSASSYTTSGTWMHKGDIEPTLYKLYGLGKNPITSEELIKMGANSPAGKEMDLFNFHRKSAPLNEQLLDYDVAIHNQNRGIERVRDLDDAWEVVFPTNKQLKSATGNVGFFDMSNPNIYKSMLPYLIPTGLGVGAASQMQGQESNEGYKQGGIVSNLTKKEIDKLIKQGFIIEEID